MLNFSKRSVYMGVLALLLVGCGTTTEIKPKEVSKASGAPKKLVFETIRVNVKSEVADSDKEAQLLQTFLQEEFTSKNKKNVEKDPDAEMMVVIKHLRKVSQGSRMVLGSLAGEAELQADVTVTTKESGTSIFSVDTRAKGASSTKDWFTGYGGSTEDLLERAAAAIVDSTL